MKNEKMSDAKAKKIFGALGAAVLMSSVVAGCGTTSSTGGNAPIKVGFIGQLSGAAGAYGQSELQATQLAVAQINKNGGVLGKQLKLYIGDSATDPNTANQVAKTMTQKNNVDVLFTSTTSASREAIAPIANASGKVWFYDVIYEGGAKFPNLWLDAEVPQEQLTPVIPLMMQQYHGKKSSVMIMSGCIKPPQLRKNSFLQTEDRLSAKNLRRLARLIFPRF